MSDKQNSAVGGKHAKIALGLLVIVYIFNFIDRQIISILAEDIKADLGIPGPLIFVICVNVILGF